MNAFDGVMEEDWSAGNNVIEVRLEARYPVMKSVALAYAVSPLVANGWSCIWFVNCS